MKTLHLLRHAKAEATAENPPAGREDHARPLAKRGHKAAEALAEHLAAANFKVDRVFCSTAVRARETLEPLRALLSGTPIAFRDTLYMIDENTRVEFLRALPDTIRSVLVVGHNPTVHQLALTLTEKAHYNLAKSKADMTDSITSMTGSSVEHPGRVIAAMAADPQIMKRSGATYITTELAMEYGVTDIDGSTIPSARGTRGGPLWQPISEVNYRGQ